MKKLISFDLQADMAVFKKPDINDGIYLTYNMLHKPCLLGILGAIIGLKGHEKNGTVPEYYHLLKDVPVGIQPLLHHDKGNFQKIIIKYNNGVGYASQELGGNLIITEQTLLRPSYRCFLLLDMENALQTKLYQYITTQQSEYIPYLGKNEFGAWWEMDGENRVKEYEFKEFAGDKDFKISTLFLKSKALKDEKKEVKPIFRNKKQDFSFMYFEKIPIRFNENLFQYELADVVYTDWTLGQDSTVENLYEINLNDEKLIQLL